MRRFIFNLVSVLFSAVKFGIMKLFHFHHFFYSGIQRFSPNTEVVIAEGGTIRLGRHVRAHRRSKLLAMDGVELVIEDAAIHAIVRQAIERNTGARGLRAIIEKIMQKVMYEIPGMKDVVKCTITEDNVVNHTDPLLERKAAEK